MARSASAVALSAVLAAGCVGEIGASSSSPGEGEQAVTCNDGVPDPAPRPSVD